MVDVRIMAHPKRRDNVMTLLSELNMQEDIVVWDDRESGGDAMYTARKAWTLPVQDGCTHRLVLQDDAELCNGFLNIVEKVAKRHNREVVTFFHLGDLRSEAHYQPYVLSIGVAIMMPICLIDELWSFVDNRLDLVSGSLADEVRKHDTSCIRRWMNHCEIRCITTVPSLVQHIGDESLVGDSRIRTAPDFEKNPSLEGW